MTNNLKKYLNRHRLTVDKALNLFLPSASKKPSVIHEAMRYSVFAGGKRLRPILVIAAAEICGGNPHQVMPTACAMELIHTYSLVHDDLPAMDDDDLRRGRPTNHKVFGDDIAILAGDALLTHAFYLVGENAARKGIQKNSIPDVLKIIAKRAGTEGMVGGQVADINSDQGKWKRMKGKPQELLKFIHLHKTAALIQASLESGARLITSNKKVLQDLNRYGKFLGLAFQTRDDVLDLIGNKKKLGKKGSDEKNQKLTFPALFGIEKSIALTHSFVIQAHDSLASFGKKAQILHDLADFVGSRDH